MMQSQPSTQIDSSELASGHSMRPAKERPGTATVIHWLHFESKPLLWLGRVRSIVEPRLPTAYQLDIQCQSPNDLRSTNHESTWQIVSWTYSADNPKSSWDGLWQLRQWHPNALRLLLAAPTDHGEQIRLFEAGAQWLIPDALGLCQWLKHSRFSEYPHR